MRERVVIMREGYYCCALFGCRARKIKGDPLIEKSHLKYVSSSYVRLKVSLFYNFNCSQGRYPLYWLWSLYHRPSNDLSKSLTTAYNRLDSQAVTRRLQGSFLHELTVSPKELSSLSKLYSRRCLYKEIYIHLTHLP